MVKLIRLTSDDDLNFAANFDADIIVPPGSKLALQNLTFETETRAINITNGNNKVTFTGNIDPADIQPGEESELEVKSYVGDTGINDFLNNLEATLQSTLESYSNQPVGMPNAYNKEWNIVFSSFMVPVVDVGAARDPFRREHNSISFRYAMLCTPNGPTFGNPSDGGFPEGAKNPYPLWEESPDVTLVANTSTGANTVQMTAGKARVDNRTRHVISFEDHKLAKGTGLYMVRIGDWADNGTALEDNGFGIGLTSVTLDGTILGSNDEIPTDAREYEIRFNRPSEKYKYIDDNSTEKTSTIDPVRVDLATYSEPNEHDIMWFRIDRDPTSHKSILRGGIWQIPAAPATVGVQHILFSVELTQEQVLNGFYPYMYMRGASTEVKADIPCYSLDPYMVGNSENEVSGKADYKIMDIIASGSPGGMSAVVPNINKYKPSEWYMSALTMHIDIWKYLGFTRFPDTVGDYKTYKLRIPAMNSTKGGWAIWEADQAGELDADDNFIVESLTLPLDCYDASQVFYEMMDVGVEQNPLTEKTGRRKNILATIPVNDNINGLVQYDTNSPVFIDLKNTEPILLRNIRLRVLRKDFSPVETGTSSSIMTLLLDTSN